MTTAVGQLPINRLEIMLIALCGHENSEFFFFNLGPFDKAIAPKRESQDAVAN